MVPRGARQHLTTAPCSRVDGIIHPDSLDITTSHMASTVQQWVPTAGLTQTLAHASQSCPELHSGRF